MFGFKKKMKQAKNEMKRIENRDLMEAIIGSAILVAGADGELEESELKALEKTIAANPSLEHFGPEITKVMNTFMGQLEAGFRVAKMKIMREIADIKDNPQDAEEVFVTALTIAEADGEIEPQELAVLQEIGATLGLRLQDFGVAA